MDTETMITLVKSMSGETTDSIVAAYIAMAGQAILNKMYPCPTAEDMQSCVPVRYQQKQIECAIYLLNKRGAEGETVHNENGINRSYEGGGIPDSMLKEVTPFCRALGGGS
jgi:hypothetical protein